MTVKNFTVSIARCIFQLSGCDDRGIIRLKRQGGFTLIETIISFIMVAILATMIATYFGTSMTQRGMPEIRLGQSLQLQTAMEKINAYYKSLYNSTTGQYDLATLTSYIASNGCGSGCTVVDNGYIAFTKTGGTYNEATDSTNLNLLKVTVKSTTTKESITTLFSK